jgi:hypothetical protein
MKEGEKLGIKYDDKQPRWSLLPLNVVEEIVKVLTLGAMKYQDNNWKHVEPFEDRYFSALMRHLRKWQSGIPFDNDLYEKYGQEISHLALAGCNIIFLLWKELKDRRENRK